MEDKEKSRRTVATQGWKQFLISKKKMLDAFDQAIEQSKSHKVRTYHGLVAESEFREWLSEFLPKRYAVTSGYIISAGLSELENVVHFDVIIYDHLNSPILWIEDNPDRSKRGRTLAIPAEYVLAVFEVKSTFSLSNARKAIEQIRQLDILMSGIDHPQKRYKRYLPYNFFCGVVFFELKESNQFDKGALDEFANCHDIRGFTGGIILRGQGMNILQSGRFELLKGDQSMKSPVRKPVWPLLGRWASSDSVKVDDKYVTSFLRWGSDAFAMYAFDIVAILNGTYVPGTISSNHASSVHLYQKIENNKKEQ